MGYMSRGAITTTTFLCTVPHEVLHELGLFLGEVMAI